MCPILQCFGFILSLAKTMLNRAMMYNEGVFWIPFGVFLYKALILNKHFIIKSTSLIIWVFPKDPPFVSFLLTPLRNQRASLLPRWSSTYLFFIRCFCVPSDLIFPSLFFFDFYPKKVRKASIWRSSFFNGLWKYKSQKKGWKTYAIFFA